jgi:hypothetical protein
LRSLARAALAAAAAASLACGSFPRYPLAAEQPMLAAVTPVGGLVRLDTTFELYRNGTLREGREGQHDRTLERIAGVYRDSGLFERVADLREQPKTVATVRARAITEGNEALHWASLLTLAIVPSTVRADYEIETVVRDARTQLELGRSRACHSLKRTQSIVFAPAFFTNAPGAVEADALVGITRKGLALALATEADRTRSPELAAAAADPCPASLVRARPRAAGGDARGSWTAESARRADTPCLDRPGLRAHVRTLEAVVREAWTARRADARGKPAPVTIQLALDGRVLDAAPAEGADPVLAARTIDAVRAVAPFAPLDRPFECLADGPVDLRFAE